MKIHKTRFCLFFVLALITIGSTGCISEKEVSPSATPTTTLHPTLPPSPSMTPTATQVPPPTPTIEPTVTSMPTLGYEEANQKFLEAITEPIQNCKLPCWLGITPGRSTLDELDQFFFPFGEIIYQFPGGLVNEPKKIRSAYATIPVIINESHEITIILQWHWQEGNEIVEMIDISISPHKKISEGSYQHAYELEEYIKAFTKFMLPSIFKEFGKPANVQIYTDVTPEGYPANFDFMTVWVEYPDRGLYLLYDLPYTRSGDYGTACFPQTTIRLALVNPASDIFYRDYAFELLSIPRYRFKSVDEALQLNSDEFFKQMTDDQNNCIQTKLSIWPHW